MIILCSAAFRTHQSLSESKITQESFDFTIEKHDMVAEPPKSIFGVSEKGTL